MYNAWWLSGQLSAGVLKDAILAMESLVTVALSLMTAILASFYLMEANLWTQRIAQHSRPWSNASMSVIVVIADQVYKPKQRNRQYLLVDESTTDFDMRSGLPRYHVVTVGFLQALLLHRLESRKA